MCCLSRPAPQRGRNGCPGATALIIGNNSLECVGTVTNLVFIALLYVCMGLCELDAEHTLTRHFIRYSVLLPATPDLLLLSLNGDPTQIGRGNDE